MAQPPRPVAEHTLRLTLRLARCRGADDVLRALLDEAMASAEVSAGAIYRWDEARTTLARVAASGSAPELDAAVRLGAGPIGKTVAVQLARSGEDVEEAAAPSVAARLPDAELADVGAADAPASGAEAADPAPPRPTGRSLVALAMIHRDRLRGALAATYAAGVAPSDGRARLATLVAVATPALAAHLLADDLAASRHRLEAAVQAVRVLAHDLNNDLTLPIGALELLRDRPDLSSDARALIEASADDLARIEGRIRVFQQRAREHFGV